MDPSSCPRVKMFKHGVETSWVPKNKQVHGSLREENQLVQALIGFILTGKHLHMVIKYIKLKKFNIVKSASKVMATKLQAKKM